MAWYSTGTIAVTNGSNVVTGTGTAWFSALQAGWGLIAPDGKIYEIATVDSATVLTLRTAYLGATASGQGYTTFPTMSLAGDLVASLNNLIGGFQAVKDEAGAGKFGDGTAAAPGVSFTADQDSGLFRSAANELGFATGGAKRALLSSTAMTFDVKVHAAAGMQVTGGMGIGTVAPDMPLHVHTSSSYGVAHFSSENNAEIVVERTGASPAKGRLVASTGGKVELKSAAHLVLSSEDTERMRIVSGNVGIGTGSPSKSLVVSKGGVEGIEFGVDGEGFAEQLAYNRSTSSAIRLRHRALDHLFSVGGSGAVSAAIIDSTGKVGIGTSAPSAKLHLSEPTGSPVSLKMGNVEGTHSLNVNNGDLTFVNESAASEAMRIDSGGNVGIGTGSPSSIFELSESLGPTVTMRRAGSADGNGVIRSVGNSGVVNAAIVLGSGSNNHMTFAVNGSERMRIDSGGNLMVGGTSSAISGAASGNNQLQYQAGQALVVARDSDNSAAALLYLNRQNANGESVVFRKNGTTVGTISVTGSATAYNTSSDYRLKENVEPLVDATERLKSLKPSRFNFIEHPETTVDGFIAHEVQEVVPEAVTGEKDGEEMQAMDAAKLVPLLTAALQEAFTKIEGLEARLTQLEAN